MLRPSYCSDIKELAGYREARSQGKVSIFREAGFNSSCAWDRGSYGACLLQRNAQPFDPNYQVGVTDNVYVLMSCLCLKWVSLLLTPH